MRTAIVQPSHRTATLDPTVEAIIRDVLATGIPVRATVKPNGPGWLVRLAPPNDLDPTWPTIGTKEHSTATILASSVNHRLAGRNLLAPTPPRR